jgi:hypothetical protein
LASTTILGGAVYATCKWSRSHRLIKLIYINTMAGCCPQALV